MRLYGAIEKVEPQDDGTVRVHGIATSETVDDQDEIVRADAIRAALPDYMRFPALREMHQLSAAGATLEAVVGDDGQPVVGAPVGDPRAVMAARPGLAPMSSTRWRLPKSRTRYIEDFRSGAGSSCVILGTRRPL